MFFTRRSQMAKKEAQQENASQDQDPKTAPPNYDSDTSSDSDDSYDEAEIEAYLQAFRSQYTDQPVPDSEMDPVANYRDIMEALDKSEAVKKMRERDASVFVGENPFDFPPDPEKWSEEDLRELWANGCNAIGGTGWDPAWADKDEWKFVMRQISLGKYPPIAPFYLPYRKYLPPIPDNNTNVQGPLGVIEELDRIEEFLKWVSYIFKDGSTYEGTVWDDYAHGKGVYASRNGLVRYEGEWLQNDPEGHGVVEVDIPFTEPAPGSKLEAKMRAEGKIIKRDFMSPEDREWLEKDIEDSYLLANGSYEIPFYENEEWVKQFGRKIEKGRYRYAGQWKHGRMHGCGVYEVNERIKYGRFYFGEILDDDEGCDDETSALHAGIAEVAAAKARMFVNKPDGMVREKSGPYNDPQHAYFYEEEDVWMAPGFINQFYEVPDYWKTYAHEVDQEREMWLNSFYRAPLRIPMPAELEYWWSKEENHEIPEFVLINKEPEPDPEDPSKLIYTEDPLILHTPTGYIINYVEDEKYGVRLFWQPPLEKGENVDPNKAMFLPLGYDDFFGIDKNEKNIWMRLILAIENACKPWFDKMDKWIEEQKKTSEMKKKAIEKELELIEAEICLEEAIEDMEEILRRKEKEEQKKTELGLPDEDDTISVAKQDEKSPVDEEEDEDEEDEDDIAQSSFGSVEQGQKTDQQKGKPGKSPFSTSSLAFASSSLISAVPSKLQQSFSFWNKCGSKPGLVPAQRSDRISDVKTADSVSFPPMIGQKGRLKAVGKTHEKVKARGYLGGKFLEVHTMSRTRSCPMTSANSKGHLKEQRVSGDVWLHAAPERDLDSILSLHSVSSMYNFDNIDSPIFRAVLDGHRFSNTVAAQRQAGFWDTCPQEKKN